MNVLIWVVNFSPSFGEITNAYQFAKELSEDNIDVFFYNSNPFVLNYLYLNTNKFVVLDKAEIKNHKFDIVLFSEYLYLFRSSVEYLVPEIKFIEDNFINKVMIGTIDSYQLSRYILAEDNQLLFNLPNSKAFEKIILPDKDYFFVVNPCPMGNPEKPAYLTNFQNGNDLETSFYKYYWSRPLLKSDDDLDEIIRKTFSIETESKQIFLPLSKWHHLFWGRKINEINDFTLKLGNFFTYLFDFLALDIPYTLFFGVPSPEFKKYKNNKFESYFFNPEAKSYIPPVLFDQFLARTDLILTLHIIQNSFIRAVLSGINGINLTHNVRPVNPDKDVVNRLSIPNDFFLNKIRLDSSGIIGYNHSDIEENPFCKVFKNLELLDEDLIKYLRQAILSGKTDEEKNNFINYQKDIQNCLKAGNIIKDIATKLN